MVLRFSRGRVGSRLFKTSLFKVGLFFVFIGLCLFLSRDIIISGLEGGAADYILTIPSLLSSFSLLMVRQSKQVWLSPRLIATLRKGICFLFVPGDWGIGLFLLYWADG